MAGEDEDGRGGRPAWPGLQSTDFESMSHAQLVALLASANASGPAELARKLSSAAKTISKIGDDLKTHVGGLRWQGDGGDTFREWGNQSANATLRLGDYSRVAAQWLEEASQAIAEAKAAMPPLSETTSAKADLAKARENYATAIDPDNRNDPDARTAAQTARLDESAAQGRMDAARGEAVQRLRKLGQTYEYSAQNMQAEEPPTFPPPALYLGTREWVDPQGHRPEYQSAPGRSGGAGPVPSGAGVVGGGPADAANSPGGATGQPLGAANAPAPSSVGSEVNAHGTTVGSASPPAVAVSPERPVAMGIDSVAAPAQAPTAASPTGSGTPPSTGRPDAGLPLSPGTLPPLVGGSRTRTTPPAPNTGTGRPAPGAARPVGLPGQQRPANPGPGAAGRLPRDSGIIGGRPTQTGIGRPAQTGTGRPTGPRGTVIGTETPYGRGPVGAGGVGAGAGGTTPGRGSSATGRRLARESGGVIGGTPQQTSRSSRGQFTPGGTGLVRGTTPTTPPPPGTRAKPPHRNDDRTDRPGLATEDEATWQQGQRPATPPVIDN